MINTTQERVVILKFFCEPWILIYDPLDCLAPRAVIPKHVFTSQFNFILDSGEVFQNNLQWKKTSQLQISCSNEGTYVYKQSNLI